MTPADAVRHVAVVGAGTVGASWAAYFLSRGLVVSVYDTDPSREAYARAYVDECWPTLQRLGAAPSADPGDWAFLTELRDAVADAEYIQESVPDEISVKRALYVELDRVARPNTVIASSTSSLAMTELQRGLMSQARFVIAHPFNPPHLIPVVEVVGGRGTSGAAINWCAAFLEHHGKTVLRLKREVIGHVINRLQGALFQEALCLVRDGVADVEDIDRGIVFGPAMRWALMGPFLTFHLGARDTGIRGYLRNLGPAHQRIWDDLGRIRGLEPGLIDQVARGVEQETAEVPVSELRARRDALLTELILHLGREQRPTSNRGSGG